MLAHQLEGFPVQAINSVRRYGYWLALLGMGIGSLAGCVSFTGPAEAPKKGQPEAKPAVWGMLSEARGCVIFREYTRTQIGFFVVVAGVSAQREIEVIEATDYVMDPKVWVEDQAGIDELQRRAIDNGLRYVKLQDPYTPANLEAARALCQQARVEPSP